MKKRTWRYPMIRIYEKCNEDKNLYSSLRVIKTVHRRNGEHTSLYHICVLINGRTIDTK